MNVLPWNKNKETPLDVALKYATLGWAVFPVHTRKPDGRCSCGDMTCSAIAKHPRTLHGVTDATKDPAVIRHFWQQWPDAGVAIATGQTSGFFVVDVDYKSDKGIDGNDDLHKLESKYGKLPDTVEQITPSGGRHLLFALPDQFAGRIKTRTNSLGKCVDVRGDGGYIVAYPSIGYEWEGSSDPLDGVAMAYAPQWLIDLTASTIKPVIKGDFGGLGAGYLCPKVAEELRGALDCIDPDESYDLWVNVGMALKSTDVGEEAFAMWDLWSQRGAKYKTGETCMKWLSFSHCGGLNKESIFYWASQRGWINPLSITPPVETQPAPIWEPGESIKIEIEKPSDIPELLLNPPGILSTIADYMTMTAPRPQHIFSINTAICLVGTVIGRKYQTPTGLRSNMYMLSIGKSGAGKDHPRKTLTRILHEAGLFSLVGGEDIASGSALTSMLLRSPSAVSQIDEFGRFLHDATIGKNPHRYGLLTKLMIMFSSANSIVPGHEMSTLGVKNPSEFERRDIQYPNLSLHLTTVLDELVGALSSKDIFSGFLNRMLLLHSDTQRPRLRTDLPKIETPKAIHDWIKAARIPKGRGNLEGVADALAITVQCDGESKLIIDGFNDWAYNQELEHEATGMDALYSRAVEHVWKLSLIAALATDPVKPEIKGAHTKWSIEFVKYSIAQMHVLARDHLADSQFRGIVQKCRQLIDDAGEKGLTAYELARRFAKFAALKPREQDEIIVALQRDGVEQVEQTGFSGRGKRRQTLVINRDN